MVTLSKTTNVYEINETGDVNKSTIIVRWIQQGGYYYDKECTYDRNVNLEVVIEVDL